MLQTETANSQFTGITVCATSATTAEVNTILKSMGFQIDHLLSNIESDRLWFEREQEGEPQVVQHGPLMNGNGYKTRLVVPGYENLLVLSEIVARLSESGHQAALGLAGTNGNPVEWKPIELELSSELD